MAAISASLPYHGGIHFSAERKRNWKCEPIKHALRHGTEHEPSLSCFSYRPEVLLEILSEVSSGGPFGVPIGTREDISFVERGFSERARFCFTIYAAPRVARCSFSGFFLLQVRSILLSFTLFTFPFSLPYMSSGSQAAGDAIILKFDMHVYTSVLTPDEVNNLVTDYAIPTDLHPCVPPFDLTMNRLSEDKIGIYDQYLEMSGVMVPFSTFLLSVIKHFRVHIFQLVPLGLNRVTMFEVYCRSLEINPSINLFRAFYKLNKQGHWFSFERRSGKGGQGKIFNEFCTSLKHWKDHLFIIDHRAVPDAMPLRHQDSSVADPPPTSVRAADICRLCEHVVDLRTVHPAMLYAIGLTTIWKYVGHHPVFKDGEGNVATSMAQFLKFPMAGAQIPAKSDHQKVVEVENERVLAAKRKTQAAKDKAVAERASRPSKKKKGATLSFALDDTEEDDCIHAGSGTHHSASPLNTIIPDQTNPALGGGDLASESARHEEDDTDHHFDNTPVHYGGPQHDERDGRGHQHASGSFGHVVSSSSGGSTHLAFPKQNPGGDTIGSSLRGDAVQLSLFVPAWKLTTNSILNDAESCRDLMRYEALSGDYLDLYDTHRSCETVSDGLTNTQNQFVDALAVAEKEKYDFLDKNQEQEERIKQLDKDLASKTSSLTSAKSSVSSLRSDLERLTVDLSQAEIVRHNYVRQLLPTVFQRLLSSDEYKMKAEAFLATAVDYDLACKDTFMSEFDSLFVKNYPYVEKLTESFRLPLGDLQNMWPEGTGATLSSNAAGAGDVQQNTSLSYWLLDLSGASFAPGKVRHLAISSWTHQEHLLLWVKYVTWPLALGLIRSIFCSGASFAPCKVHHLAIGSWAHSKRLALRDRVRHLAIGSWTHPEWENCFSPILGRKSSFNR
ncbi:hypothetical protein Tco_1281884 [Tanacetum coccineum]